MIHRAITIVALEDTLLHVWNFTFIDYTGKLQVPSTVDVI